MKQANIIDYLVSCDKDSLSALCTLHNSSPRKTRITKPDLGVMLQLTPCNLTLNSKGHHYCKIEHIF